MPLEIVLSMLCHYSVFLAKYKIKLLNKGFTTIPSRAHDHPPTRTFFVVDLDQLDLKARVARLSERLQVQKG